jgi:hypothetical protein
MFFITSAARRLTGSVQPLSTFGVKKAMSSILTGEVNQAVNTIAKNLLAQKNPQHVHGCIKGRETIMKAIPKTDVANRTMARLCFRGIFNRNKTTQDASMNKLTHLIYGRPNFHPRPNLKAPIHTGSAGQHQTTSTATNPSKPTPSSSGSKTGFDKKTISSFLIGIPLFASAWAWKKESEEIQNRVLVDGGATVVNTIPAYLRGSKDIALTVVCNHGLALESLPDFRNDPEVVLHAIAENKKAIGFAGITLLSDKNFIAKALSIQPDLITDKALIEKIDPLLLEEIEVGLAVVNRNGLYIQYLPEKLRCDRECILAAVKENGMALKLIKNHGKTNLENDPEVVYEAVCQNGLAIEHASQERKKDYEIARAAVAQNGLALKHIPNPSKEIIIEAIHQNPDAEQFVSRKMKSKDVTDVIKQCEYTRFLHNPDSITTAKDGVKKNRDFLLFMVSSDGNNLKYLLPEFQKDPEIVTAAVKKNGEALQYASVELRKNQTLIQEIVEEAVKNNGLALKFAFEDSQKDQKIVTIAVTQNGDALEFATHELKDNKDIVLVAMKNGGSIKHAYPKWQNDPEVLFQARQGQQKKITTILEKRGIVFEPLLRK